MRAFIFFSVYEELFHRVAQRLHSFGVDSWAGFVWSKQQARRIEAEEIKYDPLVVFTRDILPDIDSGPSPDYAWLRRRESELGVSLQRMLAAERHLLAGRSFEQLHRMAEVAMKRIAAAYDSFKPDFVVSEDVSCFHSYLHFTLARERGIPFWCVSTGRLANRISVYSSGFQHYERFESKYQDLATRELLPAERQFAEAYVQEFRDRPVRPTGMKKRARRVGIRLEDVTRLATAASQYLSDPGNPTAVSPARAIKQRLTRLARITTADVTGVFEPPQPREDYILYPLHFQPEASTLVQAPFYVDQLVLLRDIAMSLPAGYRLYVKEHLSSRGRRPIAFYEGVKQIPSVRLLGPDEDTWSLLKGAAAIAVITGTMGWEGLLFEKPVITFGDVFFNLHPSVYQAGRAPKDEWYGIFRRALVHHVHDQEALLRILTALEQTSYPGFIGSYASFPEIIEPENVDLIARALATEIQLPGRRGNSAA